MIKRHMFIIEFIQVEKKKFKMEYFYFLFFILLFLWNVSGKEPPYDVTCTEKFCDDYVTKNPCPKLPSECSNATTSLLIPSLTPCNCCKHCFIFQDEGEECVKGRPGMPLPNTICKPGTECVKGFCKNKTDPDPDFYKGYECTDDECYCTVLEKNKIIRIFGTFKKPKKPEKDEEEEKQCLCSHAAYQARKTMNLLLPYPDLYLPMARCLPNGQYDPLQCINDLCGCVDQQTGMWNHKIRKVPIKITGPGNPKCFDYRIHKAGSYFTMCEKETQELMAMKFWGDLEGTTILFGHKVKCKPNGEYDESEPYN